MGSREEYTSSSLPSACGSHADRQMQSRIEVLPHKSSKRALRCLSNLVDLWLHQVWLR